MIEDIIGRRVWVLDQGWIELQDTMPSRGESVDAAAVSAARTSFLGESKGPEKDRKLLEYLIKHRHSTPLEFIRFRFRIHAPLVTWWQLVRHRTGAFSLQSGRYVEFEENAFYEPSLWRAQAKSNKQASDGYIPEEDSEFLSAALLQHYDRSYSLYKQALERGASKEMARLFLPGFSVYYTGVWSIDLHNLMHFLGLRMASEAQEEIRIYALAIFEKFLKPIAPWTAAAFEVSLPELPKPEWQSAVIHVGKEHIGSLIPIRERIVMERSLLDGSLHLSDVGTDYAAAISAGTRILSALG